MERVLRATQWLLSLHAPVPVGGGGSEVKDLQLKKDVDYSGKAVRRLYAEQVRPTGQRWGRPQRRTCRSS